MNPASRRARRHALHALCCVAIVWIVPVTALVPSVVYAQRTRGSSDTAERVYVVRGGDTLLRIAQRLGVAPRDLAARNGLSPPYRLSVGRRLRLPDGVAPEVLRRLPRRDAEQARGGESDTDPAGGDGASRHRAGMVTLMRARDDAELTTNFAAAASNLRLRVERFLRARDGRRHLVHPRIVRFFRALSDRFSGRTIVVLSGYRPRRRGAPLDRHAQGYAVDLRVEGAPLRAVWEFCQQVSAMGCGLYVRDNYVHVDARSEAEAWRGGPRRRGQEPSELDPDRDEDPAEVRADAAPEDSGAREH